MGLRWAIKLFDSSRASVHWVCAWSASCERWPWGQRGWLKNKLISRPNRWETGAQISREIKMLIAAGRIPLLYHWPLLINFYVVIISFRGCGLPLAEKEVISSLQLNSRLNWLLMWKHEASWGWRQGRWCSAWFPILCEISVVITLCILNF